MNTLWANAVQSRGQNGFINQYTSTAWCMKDLLHKVCEVVTIPSHHISLCDHSFYLSYLALRLASLSYISSFNPKIELILFDHDNWADWNMLSILDSWVTDFFFPETLIRGCLYLGLCHKVNIKLINNWLMWNNYHNWHQPWPSLTICFLFLFF